MTDRAKLIEALTNEADYREQGSEGARASHVQAIRYAIAQIEADGRELEQLRKLKDAFQRGALKGV